MRRDLSIGEYIQRPRIAAGPPLQPDRRVCSHCIVFHTSFEVKHAMLEPLNLAQSHSEGGSFDTRAAYRSFTYDQQGEIWLTCSNWNT